MGTTDATTPTDIRPSQIRRNARTLTILLLVIVAITAAYSVLFHVVAAHEGLSYHWFTGFYWTIETMTTLGYGDIVPLTPATQALASVEAMFGQFYLAVTIARLVSIYSTNRPEPEGHDASAGTYRGQPHV